MINTLKLLSDKLYVDIVYPYNQNSYVNYRVQKKELNSDTWDEIFVGRFFNNSTNEKPVRIYLNDILNSLPKNTSNITKQDDDIAFLNSQNICYDVRVVVAGTVFELGTVLSYFKDQNISYGYDFIINRNRYIFYNILNERTNYLPRIPQLGYTSQNFWFSLLLYRDERYTNVYPSEIPLIGVKNNSGQDAVSFYIDDDKITNNHYTYYDLEPLIEADCDQLAILGNDATEFIPVALIDHCPSDYYVLWQDRTGAYQCQPFSKKTTYNETITTSYLTNEIDEERPYNKQITSTWTLNTDWLTPDGHKAHESILTSPKIYLFDTKNDLMWEVNCTDSSWTDHDSKKLSNLTITLRSNKSQNILI